MIAQTEKEGWAHVKVFGGAEVVELDATGGRGVGQSVKKEEALTLAQRELDQFRSHVGVYNSVALEETQGVEAVACELGQFFCCEWSTIRLWKLDIQ